MPNTQISVSDIQKIDPKQAGAMVQLWELIKDIDDPQLLKAAKQKYQETLPYHQRRLKTLGTTSDSKIAPQESLKFSSGDHAMLLETVREEIKDLKELVSAINKTEARLQELKALVTPKHGLAQQVINQAFEKINQVLASPVQLKAGDPPKTLLASRESLEHLIHVFETNAKSSSGIGLQLDPKRLGDFQNRLEQIDPPVLNLISDLKAILANKKLTTQAIQEKIALLQKQYQLTQQQQQQIDKLIQKAQNFKYQIADLEGHIKAFTEDLEKFSRKNLSQKIKQIAQDGLNQVKNLQINKISTNVNDVLEWVNKYRAARDFKISELEQRIASEINEPILILKQQFKKIQETFNIQKLTSQESEIRAQKLKTMTRQLDSWQDKLKERYQALVDIRKQKLASGDKRYTGAIAKQVNEAIEKLSEQENHLLEIKALVLEGASIASEWKKFELSLKQVLADTKQLADLNELENLLAKTFAQSIQSLNEIVQRAEEKLQAKNIAIEKFQGELGFTKELKQAIEQIFSPLEAKVADAQEFIKQSKQPNAKIDQQQLEALKRDISNSITNVDTSKIIEELPQKVESTKEQILLEQRQEQEKRQQKAREIKKNFANILATLTKRQQELKQQFKQFGQYAKTLSNYDHSRAEEVYDLLAETLNTSLTLTRLDWTLNKFLTADLDKELKPLMQTQEIDEILALDDELKNLVKEFSQNGFVERNLSHIKKINERYLIKNYLDNYKAMVISNVLDILEKIETWIADEQTKIKKIEQTPINLTPEQAWAWLQEFNQQKDQLTKHQDNLRQIKLLLEQFKAVDSDEKIIQEKSRALQIKLEEFTNQIKQLELKHPINIIPSQIPFEPTEASRLVDALIS